MGCLILTAMVALGSPFVWAQPFEGVATSATQSNIYKPLERSSFLNLKLKQSRYLGEAQNTTQSANYTQFAAGLKLESEDPSFLKFKAYAQTEGTFEIREELYFGVPEAYVENVNRTLRISLGRKKRTWSRLDEHFSFGVWQPQLRWDYLNPQQQGLTGLFTELNISSHLRLVFFTSHVSLPDQGPQYKLEEGRFSSSNRWFQQPHGAVDLFKGTDFANNAPLYFNIKKTSNEDLFFQSSYALGIEYDGESGFWTHFNLGYKPRNQIHLGVECTTCVNVGGRTPLEITATIYPKTVKHFVATWEAGFEHVDNRGWLSVTAELPSKSGFPAPSATFQEASLDDVLIAGGAYQHYLGTWVFGRPSWLQYSYLRVLQLGANKQGDLTNDDQVQSSMDRYPIKNLLAFDWKIRLNQRRSSRVQWTNRYQFALPEEGGWLSSQLDWDLGNLGWFFGLDVLGSQVNPRSNKAGLFTRYRSNDRVFGGVNYVF